MLLAVDAAPILPAAIVFAAAVILLGVARVFQSRRFVAIFCWLAVVAAAAAMVLANRNSAAVATGSVASPSLATASVTSGSVTTGSVTTGSVESLRPSVSTIAHDPLARGTEWMALVLGAGCLFLASLGHDERPVLRHAAVLLSLSGVLLTCVANDFAIVVLAVPLSTFAVSAGQFAAAATPANRARAVLALVMTAAGALFLVVGALLICRLAEATNFSDLRAMASNGSAALAGETARGRRASPMTGEIGYVLLLAGLGIPLSAAPFQLATAAIFEEASAWSLGLMSVLPRWAALVAMIRVFVGGMPAYVPASQTALTAVALVTLLIAASLAFWQSSLRRLLGFVVMAESGLLVFALAAACDQTVHGEAVRWLNQRVPGGAGSALLLLGTDSLAVLGLMMILSALERLEGRVDDLDDFAARLSRHRGAAVSAALLILSLCGVPPLPGFWARAALLRSVLSVSLAPENDFLPHQNTGYVVFGLISVAAMIAVAAPCLRLASQLLLREPVSVTSSSQRPLGVGAPGRSGMLVGSAVALVLLVSGFFPEAESRVAARVAYRESSGSPLADQLPHAPKKHRRSRVSEAPNDSAE